MYKYKVCGVYHGEKQGQEYTTIFYLVPLTAKDAEGFYSQKKSIQGAQDIKVGDMIELVFALNFKNEPYIQTVKKIEE